MLALMNHSIDLMEAFANEGGNIFRMNRRGYLYVVGAVSGYGIMSACGVSDLLAAHVTGANLPSYAKAFELSRYDDAEHQRKLESWDNSGPL